MRQRSIGNRRVGAIGLGGMPMSIEGRPDESRSIATIHAAIDHGVTLFDTADAYHRDAGEVGHNESLLSRAFASYGGDTSELLVATKGGHVRPGDGRWVHDGRPEHLKQAAKASAQRLRVEAIGLYQFHRPDPEVPFEDSIGALHDLIVSGDILMAGVSNVSVEQIRIAHDILGEDLVSVQNRFSPAARESLPELNYCAELGIAFLPYTPLGGIPRAGELGALNSAFQRVADQRGVSPQQIALAWELGLASIVIPIPGASRPSSISDSALAAELELSSAEIAELTESS